MKKSFIIAFITIICLLVLSSCGNKCDHEYGDYVILENPTCTTSGKKSRTCSLCNESDDVKISALGHDYNENWTWTSDFSEAKVELVCKTDSTHKDEAVVTSKYVETPATCNKMGKKGFVAEVEIDGKVYTDEKSTIIPKLDHDFVDGVCSLCNYVEGSCDHTELHDVLIDMGELGFCDGYIAYKTCSCGEVYKSIIDINLLVNEFDLEDYLIGLNCFDHMEEIEEWSQDTTTHGEVYTKQVCSECGLIYENLMVIDFVDCKKAIVDNRINLYKDEGLILELYFYDEVPFIQHTSYVTSHEYINLNEYDCCGGAIVLSVCDNCDGCIEFEDIFLNCAKDKTIEEMTVMGNYEEDGYQCFEKDITCETCLLSIKSVYKTRGECIQETVLTYKVQLKDEIIFEEEYKKMDLNHDFQEDSEDINIELYGDTCDDGYKITIPCADCEESYYFYGKGHYSIYGENILGNYTCVGNTYYSENCIICDYLIEINSIHIKCSMFKKTITEYIDDENNHHTVETYVCNSCGLTKVVDNYAITDGCRVVLYTDETYSINDVVIIPLVRLWTTIGGHTYEESYEMIGTTCEEGIKVTRYCENCDYSESYIDYDHQYYGAEGYHNENICGSKITYSKCMCCDGIFDAYYGNHNWQVISGASDPYENPKTFKCVCEDCGLEFIEVYNYILQPNETCVYKESLKVTLIYDGVEIIKDAIKTYRMANNYPICIHSGTFELIQIGDTGEYIHFRICTVCGKKDVDLLY